VRQTGKGAFVLVLVLEKAAPNAFEIPFDANSGVVPYAPDVTRDRPPLEDEDEDDDENEYEDEAPTGQLFPNATRPYPRSRILRAEI
jgi:hypothetical protein